MKKLYNIFLIGPMGSGKSTIGKKLSKKINFDFYDSDKQIEKKLGCKINTLFKTRGEDFFRKQEKKMISQLTKKKKIVLSTGGGSILSKCSRNNIFKRGFVVYLSTNIKNQIKRIKNSNRPLIKNCKNLEFVLKKIYSDRKILYNKIYDFKIKTNKYNISYIVNTIFKKFKKFFKEL